MNDDLHIRAAAEPDLPCITEIYAQEVMSGVSSWELTPPNLDEITHRFHALKTQGYPYLVATQNGVLLGYAYASAYRPRPAYRYTVENSIYLAEEARGLGISQALLSALIDVCTEAGYRQMVAVIGDSANQPSIRFHQKMGFHQVGKIENIGWKFDRWLDCVVMQLALGQGGEGPPD